MENEDYSRFSNLTFEDFKKLAGDSHLSRYEKIGFPDSYRRGKEEDIFKDITGKLRNLFEEEQLILDIGPGCSSLPFSLVELCRQKGHKLLLIDSQEMLDHLPNDPFITKIPAYYPDECTWLFEEYAGKVNTILCYSMFHYVFKEGNIYNFLDRSLHLIAESGEMLIGDIPNISKRKRFFSSPRGRSYYEKFVGKKERPKINFNILEPDQIDDAVILSIIMRARNAGFDAYWLPQHESLPMSNRREDILIQRP